MAELVGRSVGPQVASAGISMATFDLISVIHASKEEETQANIARRLGVTPPTLSEAVRSAVKNGLVQQVSDPADARLKRLRLTPIGHKTLGDILGRINECETQMLEGISDHEIRVAKSVLWRITRNLAELETSRID